MPLVPPVAMEDKMVMTEDPDDNAKERELRTASQQADPNKTMLVLTNDNYDMIMKICNKGKCKSFSAVD